jgi:hypothetical protein
VTTRFGIETKGVNLETIGYSPPAPSRR